MFGFLALLPAFAALVHGQGGNLEPQPEVTTPAAPVITGCSGCYVVADVAQVIFGTSQFTETATQVVSIGGGRNGTQVTTSFVQPAVATFSYNAAGLISNTKGTYTFQTGTTFALNGVTLTSPTAYNVFTAYTRTDLVQTNGQCSTSVAPVIQLQSAYSFPIPQNAPATYLLDAENSFINALPALTCVGAGVQVSTTTNFQVVQATTTSTTSGLFRPSPQPQITGDGSTGTSTLAPGLTTSIASNGQVVTLSTSAGVVVTAQPTVAIGAASSVMVPTALSAGLIAALFALPGLVALAL